MECVLYVWFLKLNMKLTKMALSFFTLMAFKSNHVQLTKWESGF